MVLYIIYNPFLPFLLLYYLNKCKKRGHAAFCTPSFVRIIFSFPTGYLFFDEIKHHSSDGRYC